MNSRKEDYDKIWAIANKMRGVRYDLNSVVRELESENIEINQDILRKFVFSQKLGEKGSFRFFQEFISQFLVSYLKDVEINTVLDPFAGVGSMIVSLAENIEFGRASGLVNNINEFEIVKKYKLDVEWLQGDIFTLSKGQKTKYDLIAGLTPWKLPKQQLIFKPDTAKPIKIVDWGENLQMLKSLLLLEDTGLGIFLVNPMFFYNRRFNSVFSNLEKFGLYIDSILEVPSGSLSYTASSGRLIFVRKEKLENLFVGELNKDTSSENILLTNLKTRKSGKIPHLGLLTDLTNYKSLDSFVKENEISKIAVQSGLIKKKLTEITLKINFFNRKKGFIDLPNCVYLPKIGTSEAVSAVGDLKIKPQNYFQLVIDPDKASADYVAEMFNTQLGRMLRESYFSGVVIPRINKTSLMDSYCYIADIKIQKEILNVNSSIDELLDQLIDYKKRLWLYQKNSQNIEKNVELFKIGKTFDYWVETLPFPLSSILIQCASDSNLEHKIRYLLHFFEALSEFNTTIMLSAIKKDENLRETLLSECMTVPEHSDWYKRPTFGNWNFIGRCIAKNLRRFLTGENKEYIYNVFGNPDVKFFEMITNRKLFNILEDAANYRNQWIGHGPPVNEEENKKRLDLLKNLISKTRQIISYNYEDSLLIQRVGIDDEDEGLLTYKVLKIKGNTPFKDFSFSTFQPLKKKVLYLMHENQFEALELLPFFQIMPGPRTEENACYFYNGINGRNVGEEIRLVSYHFDREAEINIPYADFKLIMSLFDQKEDFRGD